MTPDDIAVLLQIDDGRHYWFDKVHGMRSNNIDAVDWTELAKLYNSGECEAWELAKLYSVDDDLLTDEMIRRGFNIRPTSSKLQIKYKRLSSHFMLFNGAYFCWKYRDRSRVYVGQDWADIARQIDIAPTMLSAIVHGMQLPTCAQLYAIRKAFNIPKELWCRMSTDVKAIYDKRIPDDAPHSYSHAYKAPNIPEFNKEVRVLSQLAYARIYRGFDIRDAGHIIHVPHYNYLEYECALKPLSLQQAKALAGAFGLFSFRDVFITNVLPWNYEYEIKRMINQRYTHKYNTKEIKTNQVSTDYAVNSTADIERIILSNGKPIST